MIEEPLSDELLGYAGTPDRAGILTKLHGYPSAVVDIKAVSKISPATGVQLAGYKKLLTKSHTVLLRYAVQLLPNGNYRLHSFMEAGDDGMFISMLNLYNWKVKHGI